MNVFKVFCNVSETKMVEFLPFLVWIIFLFIMGKLYPKKPWIILVSFTGNLYGYLTYKYMPSIKPTLLDDAYPEMKDASPYDFSYWNGPKVEVSTIITGSFKVVFVSVLETLIAARLADNTTGTKFDRSKELFGVSLGNIVAGIMGGTPCTGVLVRTSINIQNGATHKTSQFINAMVCLLFVILLMPIFVYTPLCCIAAILVNSARRLVPNHFIKQLWRQDKSELAVLFITCFVCVFEDGAIGLVVGALVSIFRTAVKQ